MEELEQANPFDEEMQARVSKLQHFLKVDKMCQSREAQDPVSIGLKQVIDLRKISSMPYSNQGSFMKKVCLK